MSEEGLIYQPDHIVEEENSIEGVTSVQEAVKPDRQTGGDIRHIDMMAIGAMEKISRQASDSRISRGWV